MALSVTILKTITRSLIILIFPLVLHAQTKNEFSFAQSLYYKGKFQLSLIQSQKLLLTDSSAIIHYHINKCFFKLNQIKEIQKPNNIALSDTNDRAALLYFGTHCYLDSILPETPKVSFQFDDYLHLYLEISLLQQKKFAKYQEDLQTFKFMQLSSIHHHNQIQDLVHGYLKSQNKKPIIAAGLSMIIPGMGKMYVGRTTEMLAPLFKSILFGLICGEGFQKNGFHSIQFYTFGSLFLFNYTSNIYGAYKAVNTIKTDNEIKYHEYLFKYYKDITTDIID